MAAVPEEPFLFGQLDVHAAGAVARLAAYVDLAVGGVERVAGVVVAFLQVRRMAIGADVVPVLARLSRYCGLRLKI